MHCGTFSYVYQIDGSLFLFPFHYFNLIFIIYNRWFLLDDVNEWLKWSRCGGHQRIPRKWMQHNHRCSVLLRQSWMRYDHCSSASGKRELIIYITVCCYNIDLSDASAKWNGLTGLALQHQPITIGFFHDSTWFT